MSKNRKDFTVPYLAGESTAWSPLDLPKLKFRYLNVIASIDVGARINLHKICLNLPNTIYNPDKYPALQLYVGKNPCLLVNIFKTGKIVSCSTRTPESAYLLLKKVVRRLAKFNFLIHFANFKVHNVKASFEIGFQLRRERLNNLSAKYPFPYTWSYPYILLISMTPATHVKFYIYSSGFVLVHSAKCSQDIFSAMDELLPMLESFRANIS